MCVVPASHHFHIWSGWLWATGRRFRLVFASRRCALFPSLSHPDVVLLLLFNTVHSQMKTAMTSLLKNIKYQPSCLAPDQAWPLLLLFQDMFSESEPEQVSTKMRKKHQDSWQPAWAATAQDKHLDHHNFLITTALIWWSLINLPNARGVWLHCDCYLLQLWEHLVNGHGRADLQRHRYKVTGMIYMPPPQGASH